MDVLLLDFIAGVAIGLGINFASTLYIDQVPVPARQLAGQWLMRTTLIGAMVVGSSLAVITGWAWWLPAIG